MTPIKFRFFYYFDRGMLRLRIRWASNIILTVPTGLSVNKDRFNGSRVSPRSFHGSEKIPAKTINERLASLEDSITKAFRHFETNDCIPSPADLKAFLNGKNVSSPDFNVSFLAFLRDGSSRLNWSDNTYKSVDNVRKLILEFNPTLTIDAITPQWIRNFTDWQASHRHSSRSRASIHAGYANNVIAKHLRVLRWFIRWAAMQGFCDPSLASECRIPIKTIPKPIIFLTWEELARFETAELTPGSLADKARDIFCLCCFTSLRYSDAMALKKGHISGDCIHITTKKTATPLQIELNSHSRKIVGKYMASQGEFLMPRMANYTLNAQLKALAKRLGIDTPVSISQYYGGVREDQIRPKYEVISSHCARRTFICNALALGISPSVVMRWTGHTEYSSMKPYIDIADGVRRQAMNLFDTPFEG